MATHRVPILGAGTSPDTSGLIFPAPIDSQLTMANAKKQLCYVMSAPAGADIGILGAFQIPQNYVGTPKIIARGVIDGTPANVFAVGFQKNALADSEAVDAAYGAEQLANNSTWTGYADEDMYEIEIALTAGDYAVGDTVLFFFFRDDNVDTTSWNFLLTSLEFEYTDA